MDNNLLTINEFAKLCRSTPRTLRLYEQLGLLQPTQRDEWNKYRLYDRNQGRLFFRIKLLQNFHLPLKEIKTILQNESIEEFLKDRTAALQKEIEEREKEHEFLTMFQKLYFKAIDINSIVKKEIIGPHTIFGRTILQEHYHELPKDVTDLYALTDKLKIPRLEIAIIRYLDTAAYKPLDTGIEIGIVTRIKTLPKHITLPDGYFLKTLPKTQAYVCTYKGPTEFITLVYEKLHELDITTKLPVNPEPFDVEFNGNHKPKPNDYDITTKICFPFVA